MTKTAVIGVGYLGQYHAEKYASLPESQLIAVCDIDEERALKIANKYNTQAYTDYTQLVDQVDAVSIATPTSHHFSIALFFIQKGVHVLIEKPICTSVEQAEQLIQAAHQHNVLLQIGHLERFNNALTEIKPHLHHPRFIESTRVAPFKLRGSDVNVILDLMIHDIDLIQSMVDASITDIQASGANVLTPFIDIANARIEFANGCAANVTASRISLKAERKLRIFQADSYIGVDLDRKKIHLHRKGSQEMFPGIPEITRETFNFDKGDALLDQIKAFLYAISHAQPVLVDGIAGKNALETAIRITEIVHKNNKKHPLIAETCSD